MNRRFTLLASVLALSAITCNLPLFADESADYGNDNPPPAPADSSAPEPPHPSPPGEEPPAYPTGDKWSLWVDGPHLRGANIWQAVVIPDLDGLEFKGNGPVGPPFSQEDFDRLAALGANYVSISGPGLYTEKAPFEVDMAVVEYLDELLVKIARADMFATIAFRTGPGRSEYGLCCSGESYFNDYFNDTMWEDPAAQDAWVDMWRFTAERYRDNPIVAGYKLMVEPNANGAYFGGIYEPDEFYSQYAGTLYDWNQLYPRLVKGIRGVDPDTPILVGGMGWSAVIWLPYLEPVDDPGIVYVVHQYEPQDDYSHQEPGGDNSYPGEMDLDWDGSPDPFNLEWLDAFLAPIDEFMRTTGAPVAVDEFGVNRWVPGAAQYMDDQMGLFEARGLNYAFWEWSTSWAPFATDVHDMNYLLGPDPDNVTDPTPNALLDVITSYWSRNSVRPSNWAAGSDGPPPEEPAALPEPSASGDWWQPEPGLSWQWQLEGAVDTSLNVDVYDIDLFEVDASVGGNHRRRGCKPVRNPPIYSRH